MSKKKILHLLTSLGAGGAETNLLALLKCFGTDEFEHAVAYGGSGGSLEEEFRKQAVGLVQLSDAPLSVRALFNMPEIVRRIGAFAPDVLHAHLDLPNVVGLAAKRKLGCRLVIHLHGLGMVPHDQLPGRPFKHRLWNLMARSYRQCDRVIVICNFQMPFLRRLGFREEQIALIPNGISLDSHFRREHEPHEHYVFTNIGRLFPQKNHDLLIKAFGAVVAEFPDARLKLVGDGPLRVPLEEQVRRMGLQDAVEFMGVRRDIPDVLARSDCFVQSSRWELHPITILESMRAGLPIIATDVGGVRDTVMRGRTGMLVASEDKQGLEQAMVAMLSDKERARDMGEMGGRLVRESYDNKLVAERIEAVYRDALSA